MKTMFFFLMGFGFPLLIHGQQKDTITTKSGLKYIQTKPGKGVVPADGQTVKVRYKLSLADGTEVESNFGSPAYEFVMGKHEVIPGWEEGFKLMHKGERGVLIIPANLGYGEKGVKDEDNRGKYLIPPGATLFFEVRLEDIK